MDARKTEIVSNGLAIGGVAITVVAAAAVASLSAPVLAFAGATALGSVMAAFSAGMRIKQARRRAELEASKAGETAPAATEGRSGAA